MTSRALVEVILGTIVAAIVWRLTDHALDRLGVPGAS